LLHIAAKIAKLLVHREVAKFGERLIVSKVNLPDEGLLEKISVAK
jgi:hypothetical protein